MKTRLVTFDLDGTLIDTAPELAQAVNRVLDGYGYPSVTLDTVIGHIGNGTRVLMQQVLTGLGVEADIGLDEIMPVFDAHYDAIAGSTAQPYPRVHDALARLRSADMRMAVVTNKDYRFAQRLLQQAELASYFDVVLGGDSLPYRKPHPLPIRYCLDHLKVPVRAAAHLGDSRTDVQSARRAGVAAWAVPYGYNHGEPIANARPDRVFATIDEMAGHVVSPH